MCFFMPKANRVELNSMCESIIQLLCSLVTSNYIIECETCSILIDFTYICNVPSLYHLEINYAVYTELTSITAHTMY